MSNKFFKEDISCPLCGGELDHIYDNESMCHKCKILVCFNEEDKCPDCGDVTYMYNDPSHDTTMGTYCCKSHKTIMNQYMYREDFIELEGDHYLDCDKIKEANNG